MAGFIENYLWWLPFGEVPEVSAEDLKREISKTRNRPNLIDVRTGPERQQGIIANSVHLPVNHMQSGIENLPFDKDQPVVAICRSAHRSIGAVRLLKRAGFTNVRQLKGGMLAWNALNYPVKKP